VSQALPHVAPTPVRHASEKRHRLEAGHGEGSGIIDTPLYTDRKSSHQVMSEKNAGLRGVERSKGRFLYSSIARRRNKRAGRTALATEAREPTRDWISLPVAEVRVDHERSIV
jgi:hypothetical protein